MRPKVRNALAALQTKFPGKIHRVNLRSKDSNLEEYVTFIEDGGDRDDTYAGPLHEQVITLVAVAPTIERAETLLDGVIAILDGSDHPVDAEDERRVRPDLNKTRHIMAGPDPFSEEFDVEIRKFAISTSVVILA